jgi:deazaflavin-dependent oxidoreductase (nitroreductase family)
MPSNFSFKTMNAVHRFLQRASGGRLGWRFGSVPVVELTTIGRRSGQRRSTMLTSPLQEGASYVVVASRGGDDQNPAWFLNQRNDPHVEVVFAGGPRTPMLARVATPEERARMWPVITKRYAQYAGYQAKTKREIPLVLLEPAT